MANQLFSGWLYTDAGVAIASATVELFDRNTTTPVRANTTTDANGYWTISHATEGRFDVRVTNGSSIRWFKYDSQVQMSAAEVATLRVRNPANTFDYDIVPAAIVADRQLNLPLLTANDTLAVLAMAQTFLTGVKTFNSSILAVRNPADSFSYTIAGAAIVADRTLTLPLTTGADTLAALGVAQTWTALQSFGTNLSGTLQTAAQANVTSLGTLTGLTVSGTVSHTNASPLSMTNGQVVTVALTAQTIGAATLTIPDFAGVNDTLTFNTLAQTLSNKTLASPVATTQLTTTSTTFGLLNTTATTVNFAGAATTLAIGAAASAATWTGQSITFTGANSTNNTTFTVTNSSNAAAASHSIIDITVGGTTSTGRPQIRFSTPGGTPAGWYLGTNGQNIFYLGTGTVMGSGAFMQFDARFTTEGTDLIRISGGTPNTETLASGATAERGRFSIIAHTQNYTGTTTVSSLVSTAKFLSRTLAGDTATLNINQAATIEVTAPIQGTNVTLTQGFGIRILNQATSGTNQSGISIQALSGATNNYGIIFSNAPNGGSIATLAGINLVLNTLTTGAVVIQSGATEFFRANNTGIGFYAVTPVARAGAITAPSGGGTIDAESRTAINSIRTALTNIGITS